MFPTLLLGFSLFAAVPPDGLNNAKDRAEYEDAKAKVGRDSGAHVRLALWCEAHGLSAERAKHLAIALLTDPTNARARALVGLVAYGGRWEHPDAVADKLKADADRAVILDQYKAKRLRTPDTADAQWKLALWCSEQGLKAEETAHLHAVIRLDPSREAVWKRLGYQKHGGRWVTPAQLTAEKAESEANKRAEKHWKPLLTRWRGWLNEKSHRADVQQALDAIVDPLAVASVWNVFVDGSARHQEVAVRVFGQIDAPASSRALAILAAFSESPEVRRTAIETLRRRDPREFAGLLIGLIGEPIKYQVRQVGGPGSPGELFIEGKKANVKRLYTPPPVFTPVAGDQIIVDPSGVPVVARLVGVSQRMGRADGSTAPQFAPRFNEKALANLLEQSGLGSATSRELVRHAAANLPRDPFNLNPLTDRRPIEFTLTTPAWEEVSLAQINAETARMSQVAQTRLEGDVQSIERYNAPIRRRNERALAVLTEIAGQNLGESREVWAQWFTDLLGYAVAPQKASTEPPTFVENVPLGDGPQLTPALVAGPTEVSARRHACFGAGTPVWTENGLVPIETIRTGDTVLSRDLHTGALAYKPVVRAYHNPPNDTLKLKLGNETVIATGIHRFWKSGSQWTMARDLKPGDTVRTLDGVARVESVESAAPQPVFNLQVADSESFLVGKQGLLVHDNSLVLPVANPFDAAPALPSEHAD